MDVLIVIINAIYNLSIAYTHIMKILPNPQSLKSWIWSLHPFDPLNEQDARFDRWKQILRN